MKIKMLASFIKNRKKKKEIAEAAVQHMREETLDKMILNDCVAGSQYKPSNPYDVNYGNGLGSNGGRVSQIMVSLEEQNELSTKKFVLNPANTVRIGSGVTEADVLVQGEGIAACQCEIFSYENKVFIRNCGKNSHTFLCRRTHKADVDERGLRLQSKDRIVLGNIVFKVMLIEN